MRESGRRLKSSLLAANVLLEGGKEDAMRWCDFCFTKRRKREAVWQVVLCGMGN